ncbi:MAG: heterodisulfide reductase-related iron-sulfur binding cluster [Ilumatobacteraceae bacterium]
MTSTDDPRDPAYLDEAEVRAELSRVFEICHGCQQCVTLCTSFPTLFEMIDRHDDRDPGRMTPADQDQVVDECFHCGRCAIDCPYTPPLDERNVDFPRLMLRARAMQFDTGIESARSRSTTRLLGRTDRLGRLATRFSPIANRIVGAPRGSPVRRIVQAVTGVSAARLLPLFARERFSTWFARRPPVTIIEPQGRVTIFATCVVEYQEPGLGRAIVEVFERNGVECALSAGRCCGAPLLHGGDIGRFRRVAERNVRALAAEIRGGTDIVVPQPTCRSVLQHDSVRHTGGPDADLVAAHTFDATQYLLGLHDGADTVLDTTFHGEIAAQITYHDSCHLRDRTSGEAGRRLLALVGAAITPVEQSAGVDGMWGWRRGNELVALPLAAALGEQIEQANGDVVAGDSHFANTVILEQTGRAPRHPLHLLARAYGIDPGECAWR